MKGLKCRLWALVVVALFGIAAMAGPATAADELKLGELTLVISGFGSDRGNVKIVPASSPEQFPFDSPTMTIDIEVQ